MQGQKLRAYLVLGGFIQLSHDADDGGLRCNRAHIVQDPPVTRADLFIRWNGQADDIHIRIRFFDHFIQPLAQQGAGSVQARRIHHDHLCILAVNQTADGVASRFRLVRGNGNLLTYQRISQRGFTRIRAAHKGNESRAESFWGIRVLRII